MLSFRGRDEEMTPSDFGEVDDKKYRRPVQLPAPWKMIAGALTGMLVIGYLLMNLMFPGEGLGLALRSSVYGPHLNGMKLLSIDGGNAYLILAHSNQLTSYNWELHGWLIKKGTTIHKTVLARSRSPGFALFDAFMKDDQPVIHWMNEPSQRLDTIHQFDTNGRFLRIHSEETTEHTGGAVKSHFETRPSFDVLDFFDSDLRVVTNHSIDGDIRAISFSVGERNLDGVQYCTVRGTMREDGSLSPMRLLGHSAGYKNSKRVRLVHIRNGEVEQMCTLKVDAINTETPCDCEARPWAGEGTALLPTESLADELLVRAADGTCFWVNSRGAPVTVHHKQAAEFVARCRPYPTGLSAVSDVDQSIKQIIPHSLVTQHDILSYQAAHVGTANEVVVWELRNQIGEVAVLLQFAMGRRVEWVTKFPEA